MPYNGTGSFVLVYDWPTDKINGIKIRADRMQAQEQDMAGNGLSNAITRDGQSPPTANLPMGGFKLTGNANGAAATDLPTMAQIQAGDGRYVDVSGADTYTATPAPVLAAYTTGQVFYGRFSVTNTTTGPTLNLNGLGALTLTKNGGSALAVGDIGAGTTKELVNIGGKFDVLNVPGSPLGLTDGGLKTTSFVAASNTKYRFKNYTQSNAVQQLPGTAGDVIVLACFGPYPPLLCGTINGTSQTIAIDPNQTFLQTYTLTVGWV